MLIKFLPPKKSNLETSSSAKRKVMDELFQMHILIVVTAIIR